MESLSLQIPTLLLCLVRNLSYSAAFRLNFCQFVLIRPEATFPGAQCLCSACCTCNSKQPLGLTQSPQSKSPAFSPHSRCSDAADSPSQAVRWWRIHLYCQEPSWGKSEEELPNCPWFVFYCFLKSYLMLGKCGEVYLLYGVVLSKCRTESGLLPQCPRASRRRGEHR